MDFDALTIAFSVNDAAVVEISGEVGFKRCINNRTLTRETTVTVYRDDQSGIALPAGRVPELAVLFDEILGALLATKPVHSAKPTTLPETALEAEIEPVCESSSGAEPAEKPMARALGDAFEVSSGPVSLTPPVLKPAMAPPPPMPKGSATPSVPISPAVAPTATAVSVKPLEKANAQVDQKVSSAPARPISKRGSNLGRWVLLGLAFLVIVWLARGCGPLRAESSPPLYAVMDVNVRDAPSSQGRRAGKLSRGDAVKGEQVPGGDAGNPWVKLNGGAFDGGYVWGKALGKSPPATLSLVVGASQRVRRSSPILLTPAGVDQVGELKAESSVFVVGRLASGWWEVNKSSVVGYVRPETFLAPEPAAVETVRPTKLEESVQSRPTARSGGGAGCISLIAEVDRLVCNNSSLVAAHARMTELYAELYRRSSTPRAVREDQAAWMRQRSQVTPRYEVLEGLYLGRIRSLEAQLRSLDAPPPPPVLPY